MANRTVYGRIFTVPLEVVRKKAGDVMLMDETDQRRFSFRLHLSVPEGEHTFRGFRWDDVIYRNEESKSALSGQRVRVACCQKPEHGEIFELELLLTKDPNSGYILRCGPRWVWFDSLGDNLDFLWVQIPEFVVNGELQQPRG